MSEPEIYKVIGAWKVFRPDTRQYKQQSIEIEFQGIGVAVDVPASMIVSADPAGTSLILSVEGMRYVQEQFERLFADTSQSESSWSKPESADDDWGTPVSSTTATTDDDWSAEPATSTESTDDDWGDSAVFTEDAPGNTPDSDVWNEEQEDWN